MIATVQSVIKNSAKVTLKTVPKKLALYVSSLLISKERKNYASMARENNISYKRVYSSDEEVNAFIDECVEFLHGVIKSNSTEENKGRLLVDFTSLVKRFATNIPGLTYDYDGARKQVEKGFSAGFMVWSNGKIVIPFDFLLWFREKDVGELYKKKSTIVQELLLAAKKYGIPFDEVLVDGAFTSVEMLDFWKEQGISFTSRIPSNRVIEANGEKNQLAKHSSLQLNGNQKYKTIETNYKGHTAYFTAHKRNAVGDKKEVVFIISNIKRTPKQHVLAYCERWPVEKFFRTGKQHIGLTHCQSTSGDKQKFHLFAAMVAYAILQCVKYDKKKQSAEEVIHEIRRQKNLDIVLEYIDLERTIWGYG